MIDKNHNIKQHILWYYITGRDLCRRDALSTPNAMAEQIFYHQMEPS